jgi:integrase
MARTTAEKTRAQFGTARRNGRKPAAGERDNRRWRASYQVDGRRYDAPRSFKTEAEARHWLKIIDAQLAMGQWERPKEAAPLLKDYAPAWLDRKAGEIAASTRLKYRNDLKHIVPALGNLRLDELTAETVERWNRSVKSKGAHAAAGAYGVLRQICNWAIEDGLLVANPCRVKGGGRTRPKPKKPIPTLPDVLAAQQFLDDPWKLSVRLHTAAVLRSGELLALRRRDIDLERGTVSITRSVRVLGTADGVQVGPPKTAAGIRDVALDAGTLEEVAHHLDQFVGGHPDSLLFPSVKSTNPGTFVSSNNYWKRISDAAQAAGVRHFSAIDLRRLGATLTAQNGATIYELQRRGGWSDANVAMMYQRTNPERDQQVADKVGQAFTAAAQIPHLNTRRANV